MSGRAVRAELFALRRRPAVWVLGVVWAVQIVCFTYLISFIVFRTLGPDMTPDESASLLNSLLPSSADRTVVGALPVWGGPVMLILGALVAAADYRWGTLRTILTRYADRRRFLLGRFGALSLVLLLLSAATLVLSGVSALTVAIVQGAPMDWPGPGRMVLSLLSIWLIMVAWSAAGFTLGVLTRSVTAAIGIGLVWTLAVENLINGLGGIIPFFGALRTAQLSTNSGSLAAALGVPTSPFGVAEATSGPVAIGVLAAYVVIGLGVSVSVFNRRDVT